MTALFFLSAGLGLFLSNTATAVFMVPIAIGAAEAVNVSPYAFAMTVAIATSAAYATPVSTPVVTLVVELGHYRFIDFVKVGVPMLLLTWLVTVLVTPLFFSFQRGESPVVDGALSTTGGFWWIVPDQTTNLWVGCSNRLGRAISTMASCCVVTASTPPRSSTSSFRHWSKALPILVLRSIALEPDLESADFMAVSPCFEYWRVDFLLGFVGFMSATKVPPQDARDLESASCRVAAE